MSTPIPQSPSPAIQTLTITVTIKGESFGSPVSILYSYLEPTTGFSIASLTCDLFFDHLTYCVFQLDSPSKNNGWTISGLTPNAAPRSVQWENINSTSIRTFDGDYQNHKFFLNFCHTDVDNKKYYISDDPQEGNVPPPPTK